MSLAPDRRIMAGPEVRNRVERRRAPAVAVLLLGPALLGGALPSSEVHDRAPAASAQVRPASVPEAAPPDTAAAPDSTLLEEGILADDDGVDLDMIGNGGVFDDDRDNGGTVFDDEDDEFADVFAGDLFGGDPGADPESVKGWRVSGFSVEGLPDDVPDGFKKGLVLSGESEFLGHDYPIFYPNLLEADLERARLWLARRGFPRAALDARLRPNRDDKKVKIEFRVNAGPPVRVRSVTASGLPAPAEEDARDAMALEEGAVFSEPDLQRSVQDMVTALREKGYALAEVTSTVELVDSAAVAIRFDADPRARYVFGETIIRGASADLHGLARKTVSIDPGQRYSPSALRRARDSLRLLGLFRQVRVETRAAAGDTLEVIARLIDRDPRTVEAGVGYWTDDQFRGHARWTHRNLLLAGRGIEAEGSYSIYRQEIGGRFWWPALFGARTRAQVGARQTWEDEESYDLTSLELELTGRYRHSAFTNYQAGVTLADVDVTSRTDDPDAFRGEGGMLTVFSGNWSRDTSDDALYPLRGMVSWLNLEWSPPGGLSNFPFVSGEAYQVVYLPLPGSIVWASRAGAGVARPLGDSESLLPNKRFYAGGATSNRGFKRRQLGPLDDDGDPIGGEAKIELSTEARIPLFWRFNGVLFADAAQVWSDRADMDPASLAVAVGPGLMVRTPIGPFRVDVGMRLGDARGDPPRTVFHLTIGNPY